MFVDSKLEKIHRSPKLPSLDAPCLGYCTYVMPLVRPNVHSTHKTPGRRANRMGCHYLFLPRGARISNRTFDYTNWLVHPSSSFHLLRFVRGKTLGMGKAVL